MSFKSRAAGAAGMAAALSLAIATPVSAAESPQVPVTGSSLALLEGFSTSVYDAGADVSEWRRCGWRGCYRRGWRGHRGVRAGDVLAGVAIIGGIAAIASAANNNRRRDRDVVIVERDRVIDRRYDDRRYDDRRYDDRRNPRASGGSGLDSAVSQCLTEIERDARVESVDSASRLSEGWIVSGTLFNGSGFTCEIGNDGRISDIDYGGFRGSSLDDGSVLFERAAEGQLSEDRYASARASLDGTQRFAVADTSGQAIASDRPSEPLVPLNSDNLPAYPGGPLPGDE